MSQFTTPLQGDWNDDMTLFTITESFDYLVGSPSLPTDCIQVPIGFVTDFASTPLWIHWLFPPIGKYGKASVIHDYLYSTAYKSKEFADNTFYEAMLVLKVSTFTAKIMYTAVKYFGKGNYE